MITEIGLIIAKFGSCMLHQCNLFISSFTFFYVTKLPTGSKVYKGKQGPPPGKPAPPPFPFRSFSQEVMEAKLGDQMKED